MENLITLLKVDDKLNVDFGLLIKLAYDLTGKELLGQILNAKVAREFKKIDPQKISHVVKNIKYNHIVQALTGNIEVLPTPYGEHLRTLLTRHEKLVHFSPVFASYDGNLKFITANAILSEGK